MHYLHANSCQKSTHVACACHAACKGEGAGGRTGVWSGVGHSGDPFRFLLFVAGALGTGVLPTTGPPIANLLESIVRFFVS